MIVDFKHDYTLFRLSKLNKVVDNEIGVTSYICRLTPKPLIGNEDIKKHIESTAFRVGLELENSVFLESISYVEEHHDYTNSRDMISKQPESMTVVFNFMENVRSVAIAYGCNVRLLPEIKIITLNKVEYNCFTAIYLSSPDATNTSKWSVMLDLKIWGTSSPTTPAEIDEIIDNFRYRIVHHFTGLTVYNLMDNFNFEYHVEILEDELSYYRILIYIDSIQYANLKNVEVMYQGIAFQLVNEKKGIDINDVGDLLKIMLNTNNFIVDIKGILSTYTTKSLYNNRAIYTCIFDIDGFCLNRYANVNTQFNLNRFYYCTQYEKDLDKGVTYAISPNDGVAIAISSQNEDFGKYIDTNRDNIVKKYMNEYDEHIADEEKKISQLSFFKKRKEKKVLQYRMNEFAENKQTIIDSIYTSKDVKFLWKIADKCYYLLKK